MFQVIKKIGYYNIILMIIAIIALVLSVISVLNCNKEKLEEFIPNMLKCVNMHSSLSKKNQKICDSWISMLFSYAKKNPSDDNDPSGKWQPNIGRCTQNIHNMYGHKFARCLEWIENLQAQAQAQKN